MPPRRTESSPFPAFKTAVPRNPSFHALSPQRGGCLCGRSPTEGGGKGRRESPWSRGEGPSPGAQRVCLHRTPVPSSTPVHGHVAGERWRRRPLLCPERQLMQYRSPIVKRPLPVFPYRGLCYTRNPNPPSCPQIPDTLDLIIFIHANQSQDLPQRRRGPGWLPSP